MNRWKSSMAFLLYEAGNCHELLYLLSSKKGSETWYFAPAGSKSTHYWSNKCPDNRGIFFFTPKEVWFSGFNLEDYSVAPSWRHLLDQKFTDLSSKGFRYLIFSSLVKAGRYPRNYSLRKLLSLLANHELIVRSNRWRFYCMSVKIGVNCLTVFANKGRERKRERHKKRRKERRKKERKEKERERKR